jgi:hypothetical protein
MTAVCANPDCAAEFDPTHGGVPKKFCTIGCGDRFRSRQRTLNGDAQTYRTSNIDTIRQSKRKSALKVLYGLTLGDYEAMLKEQNYVCAICGQPFLENETPRVDHDHACCPGKKSCGKCVRGIIHSSCNNALAFLRDDLRICRALVAYLELHHRRIFGRATETNGNHNAA